MPENVFTVCDLVQSYAPRSGGVKRYVHDKMRFFDTLASVRHLLLAPGRRDERSQREGGTVHYIASPPIPFGRGYRFLLRMGRIKEILRRELPAVVEVDDPYQPAWTAIAAGRELGIPVVGFYHSDFPRSLGSKIDSLLRLGRARPFDRILAPAIQQYLRSVYNRMDAVVTATEQYRDLLQSFGIRRVVQIPLGTDTAVFAPVPGAREKCFEELGIPEDAVLLLYVGRFAGMKNLEALLQAVDLLRESTENPRQLHLLCIGEGEYAEEIEEAAAAKPCVHRMHYLAEQHELARWYSGADLFVHAGDKETFGLVSVEAQACGTRVLAVKGGGMDSTLEGEEPLVMAQSPEPEDLARALHEALELDQEKERGERARKRRQRIRQRFSREASFCRLLGLYRHLATGASVSTFDGEPACDGVPEEVETGESAIG